MKGFTNGRGILAGSLWALFQLGVVLAFVTTHTRDWNMGAILSAVLLCVGAVSSGTALALKTQRPSTTLITIVVGILMALELICAGIALAAAYIPDALVVWDAHLPVLAVCNVIFGIAALAVVALSDNEARLYAEHQESKARIEMDAEINALHSPEGQAMLLGKYQDNIAAGRNKAAPNAANSYTRPSPSSQSSAQPTQTSNNGSNPKY